MTLLQHGAGSSTENRFRGQDARSAHCGAHSELERYTRSLHEKLHLTFDILTEHHLKTAAQFRLVFMLPDYLRDLYKSLGSALDRFHDESEYRLPIPARYVIDKEGIIRAADVNADYTIRPEPSETVRVLKALTA